MTPWRKVEDLAVVICDSTDQTVQQKLRDSVVQASQTRRERLAVVAGGTAEEVEALIARAKELNSERVVLVAPGAVDREGEAISGLAVAAAVAGVLAGGGDPALPLGGAELVGLYGLDGRYGDGDLDLLSLGASPLWRAWGA